MTFFDVLTMAGGLALFLFGMSVMGQSLEKLAGSRLKTILERLSSSPLRGLLLGVGVTAVIQSSSATTVMAVGFVNSGIMKLEQAVGIIMGANVGTTVTSWLLSLTGLKGESLLLRLLKPTSFSPILAVIGIILYMASSGRKKDIGTILLGFATLMFGMQTMSDAVAGLKDVPAFTQLFLLFSNPLLGVLAGAVLTAVIQSSSASVGILQALSSTGAISFGSAVPIILGQNIGTCVTAMLSSVGTGKNARRTALLHLYFNLIGTALFLLPFWALKGSLFSAAAARPIDQAGIAAVHTVFNLLSTFVLLPFHKGLLRLVCLSVPDTDPEGEMPLLDERLLLSPSIAIEQCSKLTCAMANLSQTAVTRAMALMTAYDKEEASLIGEIETKLDEYEDVIGTYLVKLSGRNLSAEDSRDVSRLLHAIGDFERISDHAKHIQTVASRLWEKQQPLSSSAADELQVLAAAIARVTRLAADSFVDNNPHHAADVEPLEQVVDHLCSAMKARHVARLKEGACSVDQGMLFTDVLSSCRRISDHCSNVAAAIIELGHDRYETHHYLDQRKEHDDAFRAQYEQLLKQYPLP